MHHLEKTCKCQLVKKGSMNSKAHILKVIKDTYKAIKKMNTVREKRSQKKFLMANRWDSSPPLIKRNVNKTKRVKTKTKRIFSRIWDITRSDNNSVI